MVLALFSHTVLAAPLLKLGSRGNEVKEVQQKLKDLGYLSGPVDGIFGSGTLAAVKKFQADMGLVVDGIVGSNTLHTLNQTKGGSSSSETGSRSETSISRILRRGDRGSDVKLLQQRLNELGYSVGAVDGIFGYGTEAAVKKFQKDKKLTVDGIVGKETLALLFAGKNGSEEKPKEEDKPSEAEDPTDRGETDRPDFKVWKPETGRINMVWHYNPASMNVDVNGLNVLAPVWFEVAKVDNKITIKENRASKEYVDAAHEKGYQVWATVQSFTPALSKQIVTDPSVGSRIILEMMLLVKKYDLDGINIDFENMDPGDKYLFTSFVEKAVVNLHSVGATVSVDITRKTGSSSNWWSSCYDRAGLAKAADYVILMSYDQHNRTSPVSGPVAALNWVEESIQITLEEVPAEKLLMGVPLYAYDWISVPTKSNPDVNNPSDYKREAAGVALSMDELDALNKKGEALLRSGEVLTVSEWIVKSKWDRDTDTMYMKFVDTKGKIHEIWYEHPVSIHLKLQLVEKYNLAGAASWQYLFASKDIWKVFEKRLSE